LLPFQPTCNLLVGSLNGASDHGKVTKPLDPFSEDYHCKAKNKQRAIETEFTLVPGLKQRSATDIMMLLQFDKVSQVTQYANNGVYHRMSFNIGGGAMGGEFRGEMGPQVSGGVGADDRLLGTHVFTMEDLVVRNGGGVHKRRFLALPGKKEPGHVGLCRRYCVNCNADQDPGSGVTSGTRCTAKVGVRDGQQFVFRLYKINQDAEVSYDDTSYKGTQWEVRIIDPFQGANYILGSIITESNCPSRELGITYFGSSHEPIGCVPCDAYYQAMRSSGPFVLQPRGQHELKQASEKLYSAEAGTTPESGCEMSRVVALGGYSLLYESGPGVRIQRPNSTRTPRLLFQCPLNTGI
jgi:hypothetical protein